MKPRRFPPITLHWLALIVLLAGLLPGAVQAQAGVTSTIELQDVPITLADDVTSFYLRDPKLFTHRAPPPCGPNAAAVSPSTTYEESIRRIPTRGGLPRDLYREPQACNTPGILSNIVADDDYVYWTGPNGLMRLSTDANPGDTPELVNGLLAGRAELAIDDTHIFVMTYDSNNYATLYRVPKSSGVAIFMTGPGTGAYNLQTSYSFRLGTQRYYVYWIQGGNLWRFDVDTLATTLLAGGVTGYYAEGGRTLCSGVSCSFFDTVFIAQGNQVVTYSNISGATSAPVYCSNNPCSPDPNRVVFSLTTDGNNLYFFERRQTGCAPFCVYTDFLLRTPRGGGQVDALSFTTGARLASRLTTDGTHLYWQEGNNVQRLPNNAAALPSINLFAVGLKVTQGVQDDAYSVPFIQNRRTFVRFFVRTPMPVSQPVLALLYGSWDGGSGGPLLPVNPAGTEISIKVFQDYNNINDSFLFELPWEWTTKSNLRLTAIVNPYQFPLEPNYNDNISTAGPFNFLPSPALKVTLVGLGYRLNNQTFYPDYQSEVMGAVSLVRRMFPLANSAGGSGLAWDYWHIMDEGLGSRVNMTNVECNDYISWEDGKVVDRRNLCSTRYANHLLAYLRSAWKYSDRLFVYGLISTNGPGAKVRGQAFPWARVSSEAAWDADTAAHEIAHTLGRNHPFKGSALDTNVCGNTEKDGPMDYSYPYANSRIGVGSLEGFDSGDGFLGIAPSIKPNDQWYDIMGYCNPWWISDYTYTALYNYMIANPPQLQALSSTPQVAGEWLYIAGNLRADGSQASILFVRRMSNPASVPPLNPGDYAIRLYDGNGVLLADHPFSGLSQGEDDDLGIDQAVPYVNGTRQVRIVRRANEQTLAIWSLSANPPTVSNVALAGAPSPVTGTVTLNWTASDPDGDPLTFDILYQRVGETEFRPVRLGVTGNSAQIDTALFSGGGAVLRVVASDGGHTAQADTTPFTVANKPPRVTILNPATGLRIRYGQIVNFSGEAFDLQDGWLDGASLVWRNQRGQVLGSGPLLSVTDLLVGTNTITLTATNSRGMTASASVVVVVDDDLQLPGPYLAVGPDQVNWHLAPGTTALQSAVVSVINAGSGSLTWTASSDRSWLSLSAGSGTTPVTLTLTANPTTFNEGNVYTATVTITADPGGGQPLQTVVLPVRVSVGNVVRGPILTLDRRIFLPLVRR
ncbi:BACON domain-containing carbohydrate-binding protein [Chloroflexus sp.]|uniref:BACON domain-containing protein n=1 Tax=Chloroflexus sp. TaxID=1904827 RepID=UPI0025796855|nr:BACON domain-containing carbohydrate-binding protein [Chloroflexus sp.]